MVYRAGDVGRDIFGICSGVILVQCRFAHPDAVLLHMLWSGEWFGTLDWLWTTERNRRFTTIARTDVDLLRVPGDELQALLKRHPDGSRYLAQNAGYGLDVAMQCAADLLIKNAAARSAAVLLRMTGKRWTSGAQANQPCEIPASQIELAMLCNLSRYTFNRVAREFESQGLVRIGYKSLTVMNPARLRVIAEDAG